MPVFAFSAYDMEGALTSGEVQAADDLVALDILSTRGLTPVSLVLGGDTLPWWKRDYALFGKRQLNPKALELFFRTLASLLSVGYPLPRALQFCIRGVRDAGLARHIERALEQVRDGQSFASGLQAACLPERLLTLVEVGERANCLPQTVSRIANMLEAEANRRSALRSALVYPSILLGMSLLVVSLLVFYLAPTLDPVFASADAHAPFVLRAMMALREIMLQGWPLVLSGLVGLGIFIGMLKAWLKARLSPLLLRLPLTGTYIRQKETMQFCQTMSAMLAVGAPLHKALATARDATRHPSYINLFSQTMEAVQAGEPMTPRLTKSGLIDAVSAALLEVAEESDRFAEILDGLVADLSDRINRQLDQMIKLTTPILTFFIGFSVGAVILSTISAILALNNAVI